MTHTQINPTLIHLLLDQESSNIVDSPTTDMLPGKYVESILENKKSLTPIIEENKHIMTCKGCGEKGKYDVGKLVVNIDKKVKKDNIDNIQMTGYFRCEYCNEAGNWELPKSIFVQSTASLLQLGNDTPNSTIGKNLLFDGSWHRYSTDAEEHLLTLLKENPNDSYVWNRLGNLYLSGNRPELAVSAFEHSISIDPGQAESHYTLGDMLQQISDLPNAGYHFRQMLLSAKTYKKMPAKQLREMLANGLQVLFLMYDHTNGEVPFLPTRDDRATLGQNDAPVNYIDMDFDISPNDTDSFYPIAEVFMGNRAKQIPLRERTFNLPNTSPLKHKKKKKKVRKKKKRK